MSEPVAESISPALLRALGDAPPTREEIVPLLALPEGEAREALFRAADAVRRREVGDEIFLRGIIEFSNVCERNCLYCGLRGANFRLQRYRMEESEILETARRIRDAGVGTVVLQSGEDPFFTTDRICRLVSGIREETGMTVTLSIGERPRADYTAFRDAGAERYLLKQETCAPALYRHLRPGSAPEERLRCLAILGELGYEVGTGTMVGLPGQTLELLADDLLLMREIGADMLGIGPFIPHPETPLAGSPAGDPELALKVLAVARLLTRTTNIPATTALETLSPQGRLRALQAGANVVMPDFTPPHYRQHYEIYPGRSKTEVVSDVLNGLREEIARIGRTEGRGKGGRKRMKGEPER
ncbi:MAG: [FeFe] hydrogenase H-cluster radical SAM maturase HydE [Pseudomonadota bacterium]